MNLMDYDNNIPDGMREYLSFHGYHFSKKMCEWAIKNMRDIHGRPLNMMSYEDVDALLANYKIKLDNDNGYDKVFVLHMCFSDYLKSSVPDESFAALYVKNVLDDRDGYPEIAFMRFLADCSGKGVSIRWEDMI